MSFEIAGKLHKIFDTEQKTESFRAREFVIETEDKYPQFVKFQLTQDRCELIDGFSEGGQIKVHFDLRGREWNDKYFTNLNAWKLESGNDQGNAMPGDPADPGWSQPPSDPAPGGSNDDDIPF